jgi:hypothetical protein
MKCGALGLSAAIIVFLGSGVVAAQNAAPSPNPAETTPPQTTSTETSGTPVVATPNPGTPNPGTPNPGAPNPGAQASLPISTPNPTATPPQYPYPPYGYPNPYAGYGFGPPRELPAEFPYNGGSIPYRYKVEERYNLGLLIAGPTLFGLAYVLSAYSANERPGIGLGNTSVNGSQWDALYIPIAGPFVFSHYAPGNSGFIYVFEGLGQATGVGLFLLGILRPKDVLVRKTVNEAFRPTLHVGPASVQLEMQF